MAYSDDYAAQAAREKTKLIRTIASVGFVVLATLGSGVGGCMYYGPQYSVYSATMNGKATLAEANSSRFAAVAQSKAKWEAADFEAKAEVRRAQGAADANRILQGSLGGPEGYLRYLQIQALQENKGAALIYVPTEAGLPITEGSRLRKADTPQ